MLYRVRIEGISPIIMHSAAGLDPFLPINIEKNSITRKRGTDKTPSDDARFKELETIGALWLDSDARPTIPAAAIRAVIETGARKLKQGPKVREGLMVTSTRFTYDETKYGTSIEDLAKSTQFSISVVLNRVRVIRTRPMFDLPWACTFEIDGDDELVSREDLERWLDIGGRRIGLGDWRPEKSGTYGRFQIVSID